MLVLQFPDIIEVGSKVWVNGARAPMGPYEVVQKLGSGQWKLKKDGVILDKAFDEKKLTVNKPRSI